MVVTRRSALLMGGMMMTGLAAPALARNPTITLRLAHEVNERDGYHASAVKFKSLVEARSVGSIKVEIYPNGTLGTERTVLEGMQLGTIDMSVTTNGPVSNFLEQIAVFELPFLFPSAETAWRILDGEIGDELLNRLSEVNLKGLAYAERGFRNLTNSKHPVRKPEDIEGLRIRVMESPIYVDTFRELGADAIPMAWVEALTAMQQGTIDGQENPVNIVHSFKLNETQTHMTLTRHTYAPAIFIMGLPKWNQLPEEAQMIIEPAAKEAAIFGRNFNAKLEKQQLNDLKSRGMEIIENPDTAVFSSSVLPVYEKYAARFADYLPRIQKALK